MKHPTSDMILEFYRNELPPRESRKIEAHLDTCETCRLEFDSCRATGEWLATWPDRPLEESVIEKVRRNLELIDSSRIEHPAANGDSTRPFRPWLRRAAMVALVVMATMLFQTVVWSPLRPTVNLGTIFSLTSPAYAQTAGEAVPDTVLVLTVHTETTFSTDLLEGRFELDDLIRELKSLLLEGEYRDILLTGSDSDDPVSINLSDLDPLREELGIDEIHVGSGVVGVASYWTRNMVLLNNQALLMRSPSGERAVGWTPQNWSFFQKGEKDDEGHWFVTGRRSEEGEEGAAQVAWNYAFARAGGDSTSSYWHFTPGMAWSPQSGGFSFTPWAGSSSVLLSALTESEDLVATITDEGEVLLSRSLLDPHEVEAALMRLIARQPVETLTILVEDEENPGARARELETIAKRVGIEKVEFRRAKKR
jgi:hypothetical protein